LQPENEGIVAFLMKQLETGLIFKARYSVGKVDDGAGIDGLFPEKT
jgi:hypothetical protein